MELNFNFLKRDKKNKNKMEQYSFSNYLNKQFQVKQNYDEFHMGEVVTFIDYISQEGDKFGFLVNRKRQRMKESDASKILIPYNPASPRIPVWVEPNKVSNIPNPYGDSNKTFKLDDVVHEKVTQVTKHKIVKAQEIVKESNIFDVFENSKIVLTMKVPVNLPKWAFVKDMYKNAADKENFIAQLTAHIHKQITNDVVTETVKLELNKTTRRKKIEPDAITKP